MNGVHLRLRELARSAQQEPLLTSRLPLDTLREFLIGGVNDSALPELQGAGYLDEHGAATPAGEWLRTVTNGPDAISLSLRWQSAGELAELQMWLDNDLAFLVETRAQGAVPQPDALIGYASYLDLPSVMARWLRLAPGESDSALDREAGPEELRHLAESAAPAGLGSLRVNDEVLIDFASDGEHYFVLLPPEEASSSTVILASVTSWNLMLLLTAAATQPPANE